MTVENGEWTIKGLAWDDPYRICSWQEQADREMSRIGGACFLSLEIQRSIIMVLS